MAGENEAAPLEDAQAALSRLAAAGAPPSRVASEVGTLVAAWASEPEMDGSTAQARIALLWDGFTRDAADLQEQISDAA